MKMKRFFALALMALLLCLPVWARAEITVTGANGATVTQGSDTYQYVGGFPEYYYIHQNDLTISGTLEGVSIKLDENVSRAAFKNMNIEACGGASAIECEANDVTLTFSGTGNTVRGDDNGSQGIVAHGSLHIIADTASNPVKVIGTNYAPAILTVGALTLSGRIDAELMTWLLSRKVF